MNRFKEDITTACDAWQAAQHSPSPAPHLRLIAIILSRIATTYGHHLSHLNSREYMPELACSTRIEAGLYRLKRLEDSSSQDIHSLEQTMAKVAYEVLLDVNEGPASIQ